MDVVLIVPGAGQTASSLQQLARKYATSGKIVIAPNLTGRYRTMPPDQLAASLRAIAPQLAMLPASSGRVAVVGG